MDHTLNVKCKSLKFLDYEIGGNLDVLGYENNISDTTSKAWLMKEITDKLNFAKIKHFCSSKDSVRRMRRQAINWEKKKFANGTPDKGLLPKHAKNS